MAQKAPCLAFCMAESFCDLSRQIAYFIFVSTRDVTFEADTPHVAETFRKEAIRADAIIDLQNLIGLQLHREQFHERMLFGLLCKFHRCIRGAALIPQCIAAGIGEKRDSVGRKHALFRLDFRGAEVVDPQCGRHTPLGTPFRDIYFRVIGLKNNDLFAASAVFCVQLHAPPVNRFRF